MTHLSGRSPHPVEERRRSTARPEVGSWYTTDFSEDDDAGQSLTRAGRLHDNPHERRKLHSIQEAVS